MSKERFSILLYGSALPHHRTVSYLKGFENLECKAEILGIEDFYKFSIAERVVNLFLKALSVKLPIYLGVRKLNNAIVRRALEIKPHFILFLKPVLILPETILEFKKRGILTFSWFPDDIFNPKNSSIYFYKSIPLYDCHFLTKSFNVGELLDKGAKRAIFLPHATDPQLCHPMEVSQKEREELGADIVFIGTYEKERASMLERLSQLGYNIKIYGGRWKRSFRFFHLWKNNCIMFKEIYTEEMSKAVSSSKIILAFLRKSNRDLQTARTYEIPACGGFMLHERTGEAAALFEEGKEAEFFSSFEELKKKIDFYLNNDNIRKRIAQAGYAKVIKADYTYVARAKTILEVYSKIKCAAL